MEHLLLFVDSRPEMKPLTVSDRCSLTLFLPYLLFLLTFITFTHSSVSALIKAVDLNQLQQEQQHLLQV